MNQPPAPYNPFPNTFAERFAEVERLIAADEGRQAYPGNGPTMRALVTCSREQQAALESLIEISSGNFPARVDSARAVLAKYALEVKP